MAKFTRRRTSGYTPIHRAIMQSGPGGDYSPHMATMDAILTGDNVDDLVSEWNEWNWEGAKTAWADLKDEILSEWIAEHPGSRPAAWWALDAPEPRRIVQGASPRQGELRLEDCSFGLPPWAPQGNKTVIAETETAYLDRLGLLTDEERAALGPDFPREEVLFRPLHPLEAKRGMLRSQRGDALRAGDTERAASLAAEIDEINRTLDDTP